jgi:hypothetical protein
MFTRYTIVGTGTNTFKLIEDKNGAWMQAAEVLAQISGCCINCHAAFGNTAYGFGPSAPPRMPRKDVGPFCERCYKLIYAHIGIRARS